MPFQGFDGAAGTGKTRALLSEVRTRLARQPLQQHQRVLALTFMNGSRRRLNESFDADVTLRGRASCLTIDSFSGNLIRRWRSLLPAPLPTTFDEICERCGELLERPEIARWVATTFPIVVLDEAQDLAPCRLRVIKALNGPCELLCAADEFQCIDDRIDSGPFREWFATGNVETLERVHRTDRQGLLDAAVALRGGGAPQAGAGLAIRHEFPNQAPFAIGHVLQNANGTTAVIVSPSAGDWADAMITRWKVGLVSARQRVRPLNVDWDFSSEDDAKHLAAQVCSEEGSTHLEILQRLSELQNVPRWTDTAITSLKYAWQAHGRTVWSFADLEDLLTRKASHYGAFRRSHGRNIRVITIHGAKNQQFENVVVLWAHGVPGTNEQKRRLLYNAITRAERQCTIFVRGANLLQSAPFA